MFLFYVLSFFKKGDTIQGGISFKGGHYLMKNGIHWKIGYLMKMQVNNSATVFSEFISSYCVILLALCKHLRVFLIYLCHYNNFLYLDIATKEKKGQIGSRDSVLHIRWVPISVVPPLEMTLIFHII